MAEIAVPCLHCGKPVRVEILDKRDMEDLLTKLRQDISKETPPLAPIQEALGRMEARQGEVSAPVQSLCEQFPLLCQKVEGLEKSLKDTITTIGTAVDQHTAPAEEVFEHWESCPTCAPEWAKKKAALEAKAREGFVPLSQVVERVAQAPSQSPPKKSSLLWEQPPRRKQ